MRVIEKHLELLVPAGDLEKLKVAVRFGADAVYLAVDNFGLRSRAGNFSLEDLHEAKRLTAAAGVKIYLTLNASLRAEEFTVLEQLLEELIPLDLDAYIIADAGVLATVRQVDPQREIHLSTQANTCNPAAGKFWRQAGAGRINLARELTLEDIAAFRSVPELELEAFVHGAMCVAHSGRCLISTALTGRSANRGDCAQPCRWNYQLTEEMRPGQVMSVQQDERGTYLFNSRDLCLVEHLAALAAAGVSSFKVEGRMKGIYYVAVVTDVYRQALNRLAAGDSQVDPNWRLELESVSHRPYDTGFLFGTEDAKIHAGDTHYQRSHDFVGLIRQNEAGLFVEGRNRFLPGEELELIGPQMKRALIRVAGLRDLKGDELPVAQPNSQVWLDSLPGWAEAGDMLRRKLVQK
ncbi:peptidase U32 family protein [Geopsychrobacter electrodiphilus]|uniref:peptidase U32 family protein n=1 Tax=Geopsychrobacter electrodiphilus TaxID=225196 RepID=UPI00037A039D|nr:U32 family peptidase [Geopsychrobacter electrodiphilus]